MKRLLFFLCSLPAFAFSFQEDPWFDPIFEFHFRPQYTLDFFSKIDNAVPQVQKTQYENLVRLDLDVTAPETWNWALELELADTTPISFNYRSAAFQIRKLWLDDVACDPLSLSTGFVFRQSSKTLRKAPITPYHSRYNFELHTAFGKEWSQGPYWIFRAYGVAAIGQGTTGSPWLRGDAFLGLNVCDCHQFRLYAQSYWGLGSQTTVRLDPFDGWAKIGHQSIDVGASYRYQFWIWGALRVDYIRRVYACSFPEQVNYFVVTLDIPFCPF